MLKQGNNKEKWGENTIKKDIFLFCAFHTLVKGCVFFPLERETESLDRGHPLQRRVRHHSEDRGLSLSIDIAKIVVFFLIWPPGHRQEPGRYFCGESEETERS